MRHCVKSGDGGGGVGNMGGKYAPVFQICSHMKGHLDQPLNKAALEGDEIQSFALELLHSAGGRFEGVETSKVKTGKVLVRRIGSI